MEEVRAYYTSTTRVCTVVQRPLNLQFNLWQITRSISTMTECIQHFFVWNGCRLKPLPMFYKNIDFFRSTCALVPFNGRQTTLLTFIVNLTSSIRIRLPLGPCDSGSFCLCFNASPPSLPRTAHLALPLWIPVDSLPGGVWCRLPQSVANPAPSSLFNPVSYTHLTLPTIA